jgi:hypothetical protein
MEQFSEINSIKSIRLDRRKREGSETGRRMEMFRGVRVFADQLLNGFF